VPQSLPAVDGFNAKIDGYGGGASHTHGFYGTNGSFALPLAQQWGAQIDGGVGSFAGSGTARGAGHFFWRDPSIGLLGAYGSYSRWNGIGSVIIPRTALSIARYAAEGEYYLGRWTIGGLAGYESVRFNIPAIGPAIGTTSTAIIPEFISPIINVPAPDPPSVPAFSIPNRFFDAFNVAYYVTDDFKLSIGHVYTIGRNALTLGSEYGFGLGGGRMASLFADGVIGETGLYAVRGGLRIYFGQRDKTLINRNRQDDMQLFDGMDLMSVVDGNYIARKEIESTGTTTLAPIINVPPP
jgi:hypothetical protein